MPQTSYYKEISRLIKGIEKNLDWINEKSFVYLNYKHLLTFYESYMESHQPDIAYSQLIRTAEAILEDMNEAIM